MSDAIIVAAFALAGTLGGSWLGVRQANKLVNWRIDRLEIKVDEHNNLVERMVVVEQRSKSNTHRLDALDGGRVT